MHPVAEVLAKFSLSTQHQHLNKTDPAVRHTAPQKEMGLIHQLALLLIVNRMWLGSCLYPAEVCNDHAAMGAVLPEPGSLNAVKSWLPHTWCSALVAPDKDGVQNRTVLQGP